MSPQVAFVTGASSGLGAGLALRLARDGYRVALAARTVEALQEIRDRIEAGGGVALAVPCDVSQRDEVRSAVATCRRELGDVDLLVCCAGISEMTRVEDFRSDDIARVMEVNFLGSVYAIEAVLPEMLARNEGHLVGIGSLAGYGGLGGTAAYSSSKAAQHNLFESLRVDLRPTGVDVTFITPGYVRTPLTAKNRHPMPFLMELDDAVDLMARAIRRRRRLFAFPFPLSTLVWLGRLFPRSVYDRLVSRHRRDKGTEAAESGAGQGSPFPGQPGGPSSHLRAGERPDTQAIEPRSSLPEGPMTDRVATLIRGRRDRLSSLLGRPLAAPRSDDSPLSPESREHLVGEAEDLYWNEMEWEHLTEEEATGGAPLAEMTFPGLLAFVRGLLLTEANPDALAPAEPRPQVVEEVLTFLGRRVLELEEALASPPVEDEARLKGELVMTDRLLDLVLYRFHGLTAGEVERVETVRTH